MHTMHSQSQMVPDDAFQAHNPYKLYQGEVPLVDQQPCSDSPPTLD